MLASGSLGPAPEGFDSPAVHKVRRGKPLPSTASHGSDYVRARTLGGVASAKDGDPYRDEPVSLAPLDPEEALRALLAVKRQDEPGADQGERS